MNLERISNYTHIFLLAECSICSVLIDIAKKVENPRGLQINSIQNLDSKYCVVSFVLDIRPTHGIIWYANW